MNMTDFEILSDYNAAASKKKQIAILADLNQCKKDDIIEALVRQGVNRNVLLMIMSDKRRGKYTKEPKPEIIEEKEEKPVNRTIEDSIVAKEAEEETAAAYNAMVAEFWTTYTGTTITTKDVEAMGILAKLAKVKVKVK